MFVFFTICAMLAFVSMIAWTVYSVLKHKGQDGIYRPITILSVGTMVSGAFLYSAYYSLLSRTGIDPGVSVNFLEGFFTIVHDVYQLFSADSDYTGVFAVVREALGVMTPASKFFFACFRGLYVLLYAVAPILTLGVVVSVFKDFVSRQIYHLNYFSDVYIFSELNERSLAFAESIVKCTPEERRAQYEEAKSTLDEDFKIRKERALEDVKNEYAAYKAARENEIALAKAEGREPDLSKIKPPYTRSVYRAYLADAAKRVKVVFLGVEEHNDEEAHLAAMARQLGGIVFRSGLLTTKLGFHSKNSSMNFFLIGENEAENVDTAIGLLAKYATRDNTRVYVFSDSPESELLLKSAGDESRKKAEREVEARMSQRAKLARAAEAKASAEREAEAKRLQSEAIAKDPENFELYVTEAPSNYAKGALVKRVNVIRSLIYHTLFHFEFTSKYKLEREAERVAMDASRTAELESVMNTYLAAHPEADAKTLKAAPPAELKEIFVSLSQKWKSEDADVEARIDRENSKIRNIFERAAIDENGERVISAVVIGTGLHGTEMIKALAWYGQMEGYRLHINAFDRDKGAKSRFIAKCPELMSPKYNGPQAEGQEDCYRIDIHTADIDSQEFIDLLETLPTITYVAVCLGDDEKNLEMAVRMRSLCKRMGAFPFIQAIRYNLGENEDFSKATNFKGQTYDIDLIGDMKSIYSVSAILYSRLEHLALSRHMKWGGERSFWEFEYNYNSSIASALHHDAKIRLGLSGADQNPADRSPADRDMLRRLEHRRWNAYMRSEGYIHGKRDDLAKTHHCLVLFDELSIPEQNKDDD